MTAKNKHGRQVEENSSKPEAPENCLDIFGNMERHCAMRYAIWNNKGGVGKTFLSFVLATEYANKHPESRVVVADLCPQANLSEILLGGSDRGSRTLEKLIAEKRTIGSYFDSRVGSPHSPTGRETDFLIHVTDFNDNIGT
jgi:chromosome partitioning protein